MSTELSVVDTIVDDFVRISRKCDRAARKFKNEPLDSLRKRLITATAEVGHAWCESWIGYHATVYKSDLQPKLPGEHFDSGVEPGAFSTLTRGEWSEFSFDAIKAEILTRAGNPDADPLGDTYVRTKELFDVCKVELLPALDGLLATHDDKPLRELRDELVKLKNCVSARDIAFANAPTTLMSGDERAMQGGRQAPLHLQVLAHFLALSSAGNQIGELARIARHAAEFLRTRYKMKGQTVAKTDGKVFIGHGRSDTWHALKDFIHDRLRLDYDEFNRDSPAGLSTKERLLDMLDASCFAFLVLTAEDDHADGSVHARENVIHEVGLFQGRYGFERAIVLLEEGCQEFSNIHGIGQIRFPKDNILAKSEEIRQVLEREGIL